MGVLRLAALCFDLIAPAWCAGCGTPGRPLCAECQATLDRTPIVFSEATERADDLIWARGEPERLIRRIVTDFKDHEWRCLSRPLARVLSRALRCVAERAAPTLQVFVVPVPTTRRAWRRRGYWPVGDILIDTTVPDGWQIAGDVLRVTRLVADQRGQSRAQRQSNMAGAFRMVHPLPHGATAVVVDDVLTTGATVRAAVDALREGGVRVIGVAVLTGVQLKADAQAPRGGAGAAEGVALKRQGEAAIVGRLPQVNEEERHADQHHEQRRQSDRSIQDIRHHEGREDRTPR